MWITLWMLFVFHLFFKAQWFGLTNVFWFTNMFSSHLCPVFSIGIILFTSSGKNNQQLEGIFCFRFLHRITIYFPSFSFWETNRVLHSPHWHHPVVPFNSVLLHPSGFCCCVSVRYNSCAILLLLSISFVFFPPAAQWFKNLFTEHLESSWCSFAASTWWSPLQTQPLSEKQHERSRKTWDKWTHSSKLPKGWDAQELLGWNIWLDHRQQMRTNFWLLCQLVGFHCIWRWMFRHDRRWEILEIPTEYQKCCKETALLLFLALPHNQSSYFRQLANETGCCFPQFQQHFMNYCVGASTMQAVGQLRWVSDSRWPSPQLRQLLIRPPLHNCSYSSSAALSYHSLPQGWYAPR